MSDLAGRTVWIATLDEAEEWSAEVLGVFATREAAEREAAKCSYGRTHVAAHTIEEG